MLANSSRERVENGSGKEVVVVNLGKCAWRKHAPHQTHTVPRRFAASKMWK